MLTLTILASNSRVKAAVQARECPQKTTVQPVRRGLLLFDNQPPRSAGMRRAGSLPNAACPKHGETPDRIGARLDAGLERGAKQSAFNYRAGSLKSFPFHFRRLPGKSPRVGGPKQKFVAGFVGMGLPEPAEPGDARHAALMNPPSLRGLFFSYSDSPPVFNGPLSSFPGGLFSSPTGRCPGLHAAQTGFLGNGELRLLAGVSRGLFAIPVRWRDNHISYEI